MRVVLETPRLVLREACPRDAGVLKALVGDAVSWIARQQERYSRDGCGWWVLVHRESGASVGQVGVLIQEVDGAEEATLGYMILRPFRKRGFASEAAAACRDWARRVLRRDHVVALIEPGHAASEAVAARLGLQPQKTLLCEGRPHVVWRG